MKKITALLLVLLMLLPLVVACNNTTPPSPGPETDAPATDAPETDAPETDAPETGEKIAKVYVSPNGDDENGDGSENAPYATVQMAVYATRNFSRDAYDGIDVIIKAGTYTITEPILIGSSDGGTASCPVRYVGEEGTVIVGGVALTAADFSKSKDGAVQYMPADVQDKIVQVDLTNHGYTIEQVRAKLDDRNYRYAAITFTVDGEYQTIVRFPNEDWLNIEERSTMIDQYGNPTMVTDNEGGEFEAVTMQIEFGDEYIERVNSWHSIEYARAAGHYNVLWVSDNTKINYFVPGDDLMIVDYCGGYAPEAGGLLYWYNIPEELDIPGEYYIDENAVLYYYPKDGFEDAVISMPLSSGLLNIDDADYLTLERIHFTSSLTNGITANGTDYLTIVDCEVSSIAGEKAISANGDNIQIKGNHIHDCSKGAVSIRTGDQATLTEGNSIVYNNHIHDWGVFYYPYADAISGGGCGLTISHNEIHSSNASATSCGGAKVIIEYNEVYDLLRTSDDIGAVDNSGWGDNITRYNYIHDVGAVGAAGAVEILNDMGSAAIYWDAGGSYATAYGNVIEGVNGNGIIINGGRGCSAYQNLIINCDRWYIWTTAIIFSQMYNNGTISQSKTSYPDYVYSDVWKEFNPLPSTHVLDYSTIDPMDPRGWAAPTDNTVHDNWIHYNRGVRDFSNWGVRPYWIEDYVLQFSGEENFDFGIDGTVTKNISTYNSRRETYNIEDLIVQAEGVIDMDLERFAKIGRVMEEWNLGE